MAIHTTKIVRSLALDNMEQINIIGTTSNALKTQIVGQIEPYSTIKLISD